jgi:hypothetical protein
MVKLSGVAFSAQQPIYGGLVALQGSCLVLADSRRGVPLRKNGPHHGICLACRFFGFWMPGLDDFIFSS